MDLLVEGLLIIETGGREFHHSDEVLERRRRRDPVAAQTHHRSLRPAWPMVLFEWPAVGAAVFAALAARGRPSLAGRRPFPHASAPRTRA